MSDLANRLRFLAAGLLIIIGLSNQLHSATFIVKDGVGQSEIIIAADPAPLAKIAAEDLQDHIEKITGAKLPINTSPSSDIPVQIYVGKSTHTDAMNITDEGLKYGAFRMVSGKNYLVLLGSEKRFSPNPELHYRQYGDDKRLYAAWDKATGHTWGFPYIELYKQVNKKLNIWQEDERGTPNAVYEFLRSQGVRWYMPTELGDVIPKKSSIELPVVNQTIKPDFALRNPYLMYRQFAHEGATKEDILWQLRQGFHTGADIVGIGALGHGIDEVHCRDEVKKAHPEYYALIGGKRDTETWNTGKPCLSSEGLFQENVQYVRAVFDIFDAPAISVMPADGYASMCECDLCKGKGTPVRGWHGNMSDYVWDYVNRVATEVYKSHPNKKIICWAYGTYQLPPEKIKTLSPNILVGICGERGQLNIPERFAYQQQLRKSWIEKLPPGSQQLITWDYYIHAMPRSPATAMPVYFPHVAAMDIKALKEICLGEFLEVFEDHTGIHSMATNHLNLYVTGRLWWNTNLDVDQLLEEYYTNFYGPARSEMKAFVEFSESHWQGMVKNYKDIDTAFDLLAAARTKAGDTIYGKRIDLVSNYLKPLKPLRDKLALGRTNVPEARARLWDKKEAIKIDGIFDDKVWQRGPAYSLAEIETGKKPANPTSVRFAWADDVLYLAIHCEDRDMKNLNIGTKENENNAIWNGDAVEILIETQTHAYYQLTIGPTGAMIDLDRKEGLNTLWNSGATVATTRGENYWNAEVRIPMVAETQEVIDPLHGVAGRTPQDTYPWYFNVCRQRIRGKDAELTAFSPTGKADFHDVQKFGTLILRDGY